LASSLFLKAQQHLQHFVWQHLIQFLSRNLEINITDQQNKTKPTRQRRIIKGTVHIKLEIVKSSPNG
jgi:hypothetical protein